MVVLYVKQFNLDYKGKRYKAGDFVQMEDVEAKKLASSAPDEFEIIKKEAIEESEFNDEEVTEDDSTELPSIDPTLAIKKGKK